MSISHTSSVVLRSGSNPLSRQAEAVEAIPPLPDWEDLELDEIYDQLINTRGWKKRLLNGKGGIKRFGDVVGELLEKLIEEGYMSKPADDKYMNISKSKYVQKVQREMFANMNTSNCRQLSPKVYVINFLRINLIVAADDTRPAIDPNDYELNDMCRIVMIANDSRSELVDHPAFISDSKWEEINTRFVNNSGWNPVNEWWENDSRIANIHPELSPYHEMTTAQVRVIWRFLRNKFTECKKSFSASEQRGASDRKAVANRFWEDHVTRFVTNEKVQLSVLYMFWVYDGYPPKLL